jgi:hypothetical protein
MAIDHAPRETRSVHIRASKDETSKRVIPLSVSAFDALDRLDEASKVTVGSNRRQE